PGRHVHPHEPVGLVRTALRRWPAKASRTPPQSGRDLRPQHDDRADRNDQRCSGASIEDGGDHLGSVIACFVTLAELLTVSLAFTTRAYTWPSNPGGVRALESSASTTSCVRGPSANVRCDSHLQGH